MGDGGFGNAILGGVSKLIRAAIQSPNFLTGISGWSINRDGSAEFNNGTFRGTITNSGIFVYAGAPAAGNLIVALAIAAGIDPYGNHYGQGLTMVTGSPGVLFMDTATGTVTTSQTEAGISAKVDWSLFTNALHSVTLLPDGPLILESLHDAITLFMGANTTGLKVGAGFTGKYHSEEVSIPAIIVGSGAATTGLNNLVSVAVNSDYGSGFNLVAGTWTPPVTAEYDITMGVAYVAGPWVANSRMGIYVTLNGTALPANAIGGFDAKVDTPRNQVTICRQKLLSTDILAFRVNQVTGVNQTIDTSTAMSAIKIARRL